MQGEFRGDFTRDAFEQAKHFSRVLMQQGRVLLDSDWNEQTSILLHFLRTLASDLIGPHGGPDNSFKIGLRKDGATTVGRDFMVGAGHYYVEGVLCENNVPDLPYTNQINYPDPAKLSNEGAYLVYIDVWERHITCNEDGSLCEIALGGPDTATRAQVIWQVKTRLLTTNEKSKLDAATQDLQNAENASPRIEENVRKARNDREQLIRKISEKDWIMISKTGLRARARAGDVPNDPCNISPNAQYRGAENQLYRVEIHKSGNAWDGNKNNIAQAATFKFSRDNSSLFFPIDTLSDGTVKLLTMGKDERHQLRKNDWVEIIDDRLSLQGKSGPLLQVASVNPDDLTITLNVPKTLNLTEYKQNDDSHPLLRRWHHSETSGALSEGALVLTENDGEDEENWIKLEDGLEIQFKKEGNNVYRAGDYWLIPARVATGDVIWSKQKKSTGEIDTYPSENPIPAALPPHGIYHHYAPLAEIILDAGGNIIAPLTDLRRIFS
jgi:hypothetical protein